MRISQAARRKSITDNSQDAHSLHSQAGWRLGDLRYLPQALQLLPGDALCDSMHRAGLNLRCIPAVLSQVAGRGALESPAIAVLVLEALARAAKRAIFDGWRQYASIPSDVRVGGAACASAEGVDPVYRELQATSSADREGGVKSDPSTSTAAQQHTIATQATAFAAAFLNAIAVAHLDATPSSATARAGPSCAAAEPNAARMQTKSRLEIVAEARYLVDALLASRILPQYALPLPIQRYVVDRLLPQPAFRKALIARIAVLTGVQWNNTSDWNQRIDQSLPTSLHVITDRDISHISPVYKAPALASLNEAAILQRFAAAALPDEQRHQTLQTCADSYEATLSSYSEAYGSLYNLSLCRYHLALIAMRHAGLHQQVGGFDGSSAGTQRAQGLDDLVLQAFEKANRLAARACSAATSPQEYRESMYLRGNILAAHATCEGRLVLHRLLQHARQQAMVREIQQQRSSRRDQRTARSLHRTRSGHSAKGLHAAERLAGNAIASAVGADLVTQFVSTERRYLKAYVYFQAAEAGT